MGALPPLLFWSEADELLFTPGGGRLLVVVVGVRLPLVVLGVRLFVEPGRSFSSSLGEIFGLSVETGTLANCSVGILI
jgi:hypothetical protein